MRWAAFLAMFCAAGVQADEAVPVCFNYGCASEAVAVFSESRLTWSEDLLAMADTAEEERLLLSLVIGRFYAWAGEQTPVHADRGGNFSDEGAPGTMDCIDHSTTTTRYLHLLERRGALHFHRVLAPAWRGWVFQHASAQIEEIGPEVMTVETEQVRRFAVDSWYVDNGQPAPVMPMERWYDESELNV